MKFIHTINSLDPNFETEAEAEKFLTVSRNALLAATEKVLQNKPTDEQDVEAKKARLTAYQQLLVVGVPNILPAALKFAEELKHDRHAILAELGEAGWLDFKMSTIPTADAKERRVVIDAVAAQLRKKPQTFLDFATQAGQMLEILGDGSTAAYAYGIFGDVLSKNLDENLLRHGRNVENGRRSPRPPAHRRAAADHRQNHQRKTVRYQ